MLPQETMAQHSSTTDDWFTSSAAQWVWPHSSGNGPNQYVQFVHEVEIPDGGTSSPRLAISVDTNYAAWLNGEFVGFGQWSDFPDDKTFDVLDLKKHARVGQNRLCILAWYQGESSSMYLKGPPGLGYAVEANNKLIVHSGPDTRMRPAPDYVSGGVPRVTGQLSFTFEYHAENGDDWLRGGASEGAGWVAASSDELKPLASRPIRPRPLPKLLYGERIPMSLISQGAFTRTGKPANAAVAVQTDALAWRAADDMFEHPHNKLPDPEKTGLKFKPSPLPDSTGTFVVLDTGREEAGLLDLEIDAPAGTILDIAYGEHLEDLRVRAHVGGRNFASRYVCREGRHGFVHPFLRLAGRYIQLHVTAPETASPITLHYAGLRPTDYPVPTHGSFECPDSLHNKIYEVSARTLHLCMHEHYEDCPWREQALYAMDARNQALAGYYCFGNYDFAAESIRLLGQGMNEKDGFLELCAPASVAVNIPSFSLAWILMLDDHLVFSGNRDFAREQLPIARQIFDTCERNTTGPLILTPRGKRMWNFYEWAPGLDGGGFAVLEGERYDAPLNLFYVLALDAAARIARETGQDDSSFTTRATAVRRAFAEKFWNAKERAFVTVAGPAAGAQPHFAELTQALAIIAGVVPSDALENLRVRLASDDNGLVPCTISHTLYKFEALLTDRDRFAPRVFELIRRDWGYMLNQGATSFWETIDGASAFGNAGSLCHGWSGIPAWFYGAYILGVTPTAPGFETYKVNPVVNVVTSARGNVPTPTTPIAAKWRLENGKIVNQTTR